MDKSTELIAALEPNQITAVALQPLPRRQLGRATVALLILLRIYIIIAVPIVGYAFVNALMNSGH